MTTARNLIDALRRHHESPPSKPIGGYLATEIQAPDSDRRADALWLPINYANRGDIIGYETKVTRQDVLAELRDTQKADGWERFCSRWWLLIPDTKIIEGLDIPERWGIVTPQKAANRRSLTVVRQAPALRPLDGRRALGTVLAKVLYGGDAAEAKLRNALSRDERSQQMVEQLREENRKLSLALGEEGIGTSRARTTVVNILAEIDKLGGYGPDADKRFEAASWHVTPERVARAVLAAVAAEDLSKRVLDEIEEAHTRTSTAAKRLELLKGALA